MSTAVYSARRPLAAVFALSAPAAVGAEVLPVAGQAFQVVTGLAIVLALIALAAWGTRRLQGIRSPSRGRIRVIEALPLGARERLLLVEVDERRVLIGMCPGRIATLHAFPAGSEASFSDALAVASQTAPGSNAA